MNKYVKIVLVVVLIVGVFVLALFVSGKKQVEFITNEDYEKISNDDGIVYYGKSEDLSKIKDAAKEYQIHIDFLDSGENENKDLQEGTLYVYDDGKEVYTYSDDISSYKLEEGLMQNGIIPKNYLTVTLDEYKEIIKEKGYHFMFIGRETCSYCTKFKESIREAMKDNDFMVYYIDTDSLTGDNDFNELVATDKYMSENEWGTPLNLLYKDGERINYINGYVPADELVKFLKDNKVI